MLKLQTTALSREGDDVNKGFYFGHKFLQNRLNEFKEFQSGQHEFFGGNVTGNQDSELEEKKKELQELKKSIKSIVNNQVRMVSPGLSCLNTFSNCSQSACVLLLLAITFLRLIDHQKITLI